MERLRNVPKVVGLKQSRKAILGGRAAQAFYAQDADAYLLDSFLELCRAHNVPAVAVPAMKELAKACHVEVPTAFAVLLRVQQ